MTNEGNWREAKNSAVEAALYRHVNSKIRKSMKREIDGWIEKECNDIEERFQAIIRDHQRLENHQKRTSYCHPRQNSEMPHGSSKTFLKDGSGIAQNCSITPSENDLPYLATLFPAPASMITKTLRENIQATLRSLYESAGVYNILAELT